MRERSDVLAALCLLLALPCLVLGAAPPEGKRSKHSARIVPQPVEYEELSGKPIELGTMAIVIADRAPMAHHYIAEKIQQDLGLRFGVSSVISNANGWPPNNSSAPSW